MDDQGNITDTYRNAVESGTLAPLKSELEPLTDPVHQLIQVIFDPSVLKDIAGNGHDTKVQANPLNENWKDFQELWERLNQKYAYTVEFDAHELIQKAVAAGRTAFLHDDHRHSNRRGVHEGAYRNQVVWGTGKPIRKGQDHHGSRPTDWLHSGEHL